MVGTGAAGTVPAGLRLTEGTPDAQLTAVETAAKAAADAELAGEEEAVTPEQQLLREIAAEFRLPLSTVQHAFRTRWEMLAVSRRDRASQPRRHV